MASHYFENPKDSRKFSISEILVMSGLCIWSHIFRAQPITTTYPNNLLGKLSQIGADVSAILASLQKRGEDKPDTCLYIDTIWIISANGG